MSHLHSVLATILPLAGAYAALILGALIILSIIVFIIVVVVVGRRKRRRLGPVPPTPEQNQDLVEEMEDEIRRGKGNATGGIT
jgi:hypothetical protein